MTVARPETPAVPALAGRSRFAFARVPLAVLVVGAAAFAGHLAGATGGGEATNEEMSAGPVRMVAPGGWKVTSSAPPLGGLRLDRASAGHPARGSGVAVAGMLPGVLFAQELGSSVDPAAPAPDAVRLGRLEAYRWHGLDGGDGPLTLMAAPTAMGTAVVACEGAPSTLRQCERAAATLTVSGAEPTPLDTLAFYASELDATLGRLESRRTAGVARLRARATAAEHAASASRLQGAYERAARSLGDLAPPVAAGKANERLIEELERTGAAYGDAARAARRDRRSAYAAAARAAERREAGLRAALARMVPPG